MSPMETDSENIGFLRITKLAEIGKLDDLNMASRKLGTTSPKLNSNFP